MVRPGWADRLQKLASYLTLGNVVPCLILLGIAGFFLLELVIPEICDLTAFWGAPPGIVDQDPLTTPSPIKPFLFKGTHGLYTHKRLYRVEPVNDYVIEARVLHTRHYYSDHNSADLIPFDMGLGWKMMSDAESLRRYFTFHHSNIGGRVLWTVPSKNIPYSYGIEIEAGLYHSNNHLIPGNQAIYDVLRHVQAGDFIRLKGQLVNVTRPDLPGWQWITTKRLRGDANKETHWGSGDAQTNMTDCDTMFVTDAQILAAP